MDTFLLVFKDTSPIRGESGEKLVERGANFLLLRLGQRVEFGLLSAHYLERAAEPLQSVNGLVETGRDLLPVFVYSK